MSIVEGPPNVHNLVTRVQNILLKPNEEWAVIDAEEATVRGLFTGYAAILAAIPAIGAAIGGLMPFFLSFNPIGSVIRGALAYVLGLAALYAAGLILEAVAPSFEARKDQIKAFKLVVYSLTPFWIAGVLFLFWPLSGLVWVGGLYSFYLVWLGVPKLLAPPADKAVVMAVVAMVIVGAVMSVTHSAIWRWW